MKKTLGICMFLILLLAGCRKHERNSEIVSIPKPEVKENGQVIEFTDAHQISQFETLSVKKQNVTAQFSAPAHVMATVVTSDESSLQNLILFDNSDLSYNYASYLQHLVLINQWKININRVKDLLAHGAATGKDLIEAQTQLANEEAIILEHETKLKLGGFDPKALKAARAKTVWILCNVPENQVDKVLEGNKCTVHFSSFPNENHYGRVEAVGDVVDNLTRMIKIRIILSNPDGRVKAGMYATVDFGLAEGNFITVPRSAIITVNGKSFVFVKTDKSQFKRQEILLGQQIDDKNIILRGLNDGDSVVVTSAIQLKGLSFGY